MNILKEIAKMQILKGQILEISSGQYDSICCLIYKAIADFDLDCIKAELKEASKTSKGRKRFLGTLEDYLIAKGLISRFSKIDHKISI